MKKLKEFILNKSHEVIQEYFLCVDKYIYLKLIDK